MTTTREAIGVLNGLMEVCLDTERGFRSAAEHVASLGLRELFSSYARQRLQFAEELGSEVRRLGGRPEIGVSATAALHRGWVDVKSSLQRNEEGSVVAELERGEDAAVRSYRDALSTGVPLELRPLVERQYARVQEIHDRVRSLEKATA